mmetsp:Transcript_19954/g.28678  ORF Transcript_19954/g.28678 Transcript_19954/m.28678 type:complete len:241 (+) Transcript_19954:112-834(+)|eukprot:CAMPEP_0185035530 /NCGR_PEP_ID=MMETSP1103-20130426/27078_1 /TAXON_ID=36769 /ORGANISM="Paraphysomonas bandaiensis, Strain Caron Lab Isolate" /LENGTH=240 /DNA_ID=CAMNT_0027572651 /DNA_START=68 /DNA_END=790 /DNA_ORIENTATION=-
MITEALIIRQSGEYDCEVITKLKIEKLGIQKISNLDNCTSLIDLSLANNDIMQISGLDCLVSLKRLNLSFNKIRRIENVLELENLEYFDLRANSISQMDDVVGLGKLPKLSNLALRGLGGDDANPVCQHPAYRSIITRSLPNLTILDGGLMGLIEASDEIEKHLESLQPQNQDDEEASAITPWIDAESLKDASDPVDIESFMDRFPELRNAHDRAEDMLREDSAHVLRQASAALNKAKVK